MQQRYAGGGTSSGQRLDAVSKTISQSPRPELERWIAANQPKVPKKDRSGQVAAAGAATAGAGAIASSSGQRTLRSMKGGIDEAGARAKAAADKLHEARAQQAGAVAQRGDAERRLATIGERQRAMQEWQRQGMPGKHPTRVRWSTGRAQNVKASRHSADRVSNAMVRRRNVLGNQVKEAKDIEGRALKDMKASAGARKIANRDAVSRIQEFQRKRPGLQRRITGGRVAMVGGSLASMGALVHGERKRQVTKGLPRYLRDIAPGIGAAPPRQFRGGTPFARSDYPYLRVRANQLGQQASRANAEWGKLSKKPLLQDGNLGRAEAKRQETLEAARRGQLGREASRRAVTDNTPIARNTRRRR